MIDKTLYSWSFSKNWRRIREGEFYIKENGKHSKLFKHSTFSFPFSEIVTVIFISESLLLNISNDLFASYSVLFMISSTFNRLAEREVPQSCSSFFSITSMTPEVSVSSNFPIVLIVSFWYSPFDKNPVEELVLDPDSLDELNSRQRWIYSLLVRMIDIFHFLLLLDFQKGILFYIH